jgi:2-oxo-4-hydroxy-4-carboxy-5-ureidoimidazoline decarboxylase
MMTETHTPNSTLAALQNWNHLDARIAAETILPCNGSRAWAAGVVALRPFETPEALFAAADSVWLALPESDWQQAFDSHPRIGEHQIKAESALSTEAKALSPEAKALSPEAVALSPEAVAQSLQWSSAEQSAAQLTAGAQTALAAANREYENRFDHIFLVCASGKSAAGMLTILQRRLTNDPRTELHESAEQQRQITQLRLRKWLAAS